MTLYISTLIKGMSLILTFYTPDGNLRWKLIHFFLQKSSAVAGKKIANAQTISHILGSKLTKDNQG